MYNSSCFIYRSSGSQSPMMSPVLIPENNFNFNWVDITEDFFNAVKGKHDYHWCV